MNNFERKASELFLATLEMNAPDERARYLDEACGGDVELRQRVDALLRAYDRDGNFLAIDDESQAVLEGIGTVIDRYKLLEEIGEGGFGVVFMAEQTEPIRRRVALKIIKPGMDTRQVIARFETERQALALMDHPNIAHVFDAGSTDTGRPYFVMEMVRGVPITQYCDDNELTSEERLKLFMPVCEAVQHAHQKGIIHRDIKPSNILVTLHDGKPVPKVIDFGTAKALQQPLTDKTMFTAYGKLIGTPQYMSPEQAEMSGLDVDTRADIYALGVLLYEMLTGTTPFEAKQLRAVAFEEMMRMIREQDPPKPSTRVSLLGARATDIAKHRQVDQHRLHRALRGDLDWIVMKALEKERQRRYETANDLYADVQRHLDHQPVLASSPGAAYRARKFIRRHRTTVTTTCVIMALIAAGTLISLNQARRARDQAQRLQQRAEWMLYENSIALAESAWRAHDLKAMWPALDDCPERYRGWEWRYLKQQSHLHFDGLNGGTNKLTALARSLDERYIATLSDAGRLQLWNAEQRKMLWEHSNVTNTMGSLSFTQGDSQLVLAGAEEEYGGLFIFGWAANPEARSIQVRSWRVADGRELDRQQYPCNGYYDATVSAGGTYLAVAEADGAASVWDLTTGEVIQQVRVPSNSVLQVVFSQDEKSLASLCLSQDLMPLSGEGLPPFKHCLFISGAVHILSLPDGNMNGLIKDVGWPTSAAFNTSGDRLAVGFLTGIDEWWLQGAVVTVYRKSQKTGWAEPRPSMHSLRKNDRVVFYLRFDDTGPSLVAAMHDLMCDRGEIYHWGEDRWQGEETSVLPLEDFDNCLPLLWSGSPTAQLWQLCLVNTGIFDGFSERGSVMLCEAHQPWQERSIRRPFSSIALDADGKRAVAESGTVSNRTLAVFDLETGEPLLQLPTINSSSWPKAVLSDDRLVALLPDPVRIEVWSVKNGTKTLTIPVSRIGWYHSATLTVNRQADLLALQLKRDIPMRLYQLSSGSPVDKDINAEFLCWLPDGQFLARRHMPDGSSAVAVMSVAGEELRRLVKLNDGSEFKASPDGRLLAVVPHGARGGLVAIYETRDWQLLCSSRIKRVKRVTSLAFSPDNQRLAVLSEPEGTIHGSEIFLLDTTFGHTLLTLPGSLSPGRDPLLFSPDGSTLSVSHSGGIRSWHAPDAPLGWIRADSREWTPH